MSLSKPSISKMEPQPSTSAAATKQLEILENKLSKSEQEKKRIQILAAMICTGCRCGWLCCDCSLGCMSCKQRSRFCYCQYAQAGLPGVLVKIPCLICSASKEGCTCNLAWHCKWCIVSINMCKRGGCITWLPDRRSPEAAAFVEIFNREDKSDDDESVVENMTLKAERSSGFTWNRNSSQMSSWSVESSEPSVYASSTTVSSVNSGDSYGSGDGKSD